MTGITLSCPCGVRGAKEKCWQCHGLDVKKDREEGVLSSAQRHRGYSVLRWAVTFQGKGRHTQVQRSREQGLRRGSENHSLRLKM